MDTRVFKIRHYCSKSLVRLVGIRILYCCKGYHGFFSCFYASYDTWVSNEEVSDEPEPQPQHHGQWEVRKSTWIILLLSNEYIYLERIVCALFHRRN